MHPHTTFKIENFGAGILGTVFEGDVDVATRIAAVDAMHQAIAGSDPPGYLVDLSQAAIKPYESPAVAKLVERMERTDLSRRVAYVMRPHQSDLLATLLIRAHAPLFRRFHSRETALAWLMQAT